MCYKWLQICSMILVVYTFYTDNGILSSDFEFTALAHVYADTYCNTCAHTYKHQESMLYNSVIKSHIWPHQIQIVNLRIAWFIVLHREDNFFS